jgi:hypothetical protein
MFRTVSFTYVSILCGLFEVDSCTWTEGTGNDRILERRIGIKSGMGRACSREELV